MSKTSENNKRIAKNTIFLYIRTFITMVVSLYTSRVVLNALGVEDFGIWGVLGGIVAMFSFINTSLSSSIFRYITHAIGVNDNNLLVRTYNASIIVHIILAVIVFIFCETIGQWFLTEKMVVPIDKRDMAVIVFHIVIATSCISLVTVPFNSVIISYERMNIYAYMAILDVFIKLVVAYIVCIVQSYKLVWYASMMLIVSICMLVFYILYVHRQFPLLKIQRIKDKSIFKSILGFSGWSLVGNLAYVGYSQGLNILINMFYGPVVNAARAISLQIEQTVRTFVGNFQTALNPQIIKNYAQNEFSQMHLLIIRGSKFSLYLLFLFALPIMLETDHLLFLWLKHVPEHTVAFCRIMFFVIALETISNSLGIGVVATGKIKYYHIIVGSILLCIVPLSYISLKLGGSAESVFYIYLIVEMFAVASRLLIAHHQIGLPFMDFIYKVIARPSFVILLSSFIPFLLHVYLPQGFLRLSCVVVGGIVTSGICIYFLGLDANEKNVVYEKLVKRIIRRK